MQVHGRGGATNDGGHPSGWHGHTDAWLGEPSPLPSPLWDGRRGRLRILEREADAERRAHAVAESAAAKPIKLPTPKDMVRVVFDLERRLLADVAKGREELRRLFRGGRIDLIPQPGGFYVARSEILPLVLLTQTSPGENPGFVRYTASSCAGANRPISTSEEGGRFPFLILVPPPVERRKMPTTWKRKVA
jgi:hypothetical protein